MAIRPALQERLHGAVVEFARAVEVDEQEGECAEQEGDHDAGIERRLVTALLAQEQRLGIELDPRAAEEPHHHGRDGGEKYEREREFAEGAVEKEHRKATL